MSKYGVKSTVVIYGWLCFTDKKINKKITSLFYFLPIAKVDFKIKLKSEKTDINACNNSTLLHKNILKTMEIC